MGEGVEGILGAVPSISKLRGTNNDDWIDRLNHRYTVLLLVIFAVVVSTGQFVGEPIQCWCPAEFTDAYEAYTTYICWISNTYYIPMEETIPIDIRQRQDAEITYYQWVPIILLFQALLFKIPNLFWRFTHSASGVNLDKIVAMSEETQLGSPEDRAEAIKNLAMYLDKWLDTYQEYKNNIFVRAKKKAQTFCFFMCDRRGGTYLVGLFITIKILYMANVIGQFFLLNAFMATKYNLYGFEVIKSLIENEPMMESPRFPRVTLCDFQIRQLQNLQRWTVQCVLPVNLFNEKIFIFLWFWYCLIAFLTAVNLVKWVFYQLYQNNKVQYVKKYLKTSNEINSGFDKKLCAKFSRDYLRNDGIFLMYVISKNSTNLVVADLIKELWKIFKSKHKPHSNNVEDEPMMNSEKEPLSGSHLLNSSA
uniref:Innexin n=1 Tax=Magallana gigas TaxID=29159 RepID=A0A8W8LHA9_MAGGI|nr:innexin unc-9 isoform X3 [Crassostrea gigas]|eukprot:XP_011426037.1 PREDICTED: innexin unc-9 isoform X3 [Crassostrea gigas]